MNFKEFKNEIEFFNNFVEGLPPTIEHIVDQIDEDNVSTYGTIIVHTLCKACEIARDRGTFILSLPSEISCELNDLLDDNYVIAIYREFKTWYPKTYNKKFERLEDQMNG